MNIKGLSFGTYISKRPKGNFDESLCANCEKMNINGKIKLPFLEKKDT